MKGEKHLQDAPFPQKTGSRRVSVRAAAFFKLFGGRAYRIFSAEKKKKKKSATNFVQ